MKRLPLTPTENTTYFTHGAQKSLSGEEQLSDRDMEYSMRKTSANDWWEKGGGCFHSYQHQEKGTCPLLKVTKATGNHETPPLVQAMVKAMAGTFSRKNACAT